MRLAIQISLFAFLLANAAALATKPCEVELARLRARALEHGLRSLHYVEELTRLRKELELARERKQLFDNYVGDGGLLSFPNVYFFVAAMFEAKRQEVQRGGGGLDLVMRELDYVVRHSNWGQRLADTADLLNGLLSKSWTKTPETEAEADHAAAMIAIATVRLKEIVSAAFRLPQHDVDQWVTPEATRALARAFFRVNLTEDAPALMETLFKQTWDVTRFEKAVDGRIESTEFLRYLGAIGAGGSWTMPESLFPLALVSIGPEPVLKEEPVPTVLNPVGRHKAIAENEQRRKQHQAAWERYQRKVSFLEGLRRTALRNDLEQQVAIREKAISQLLGEPPRPREAPPSPRYEPSEELRQALGNAGGSDVIATLLKFKHALRAKYFREGSFFKSKAAEILDVHTDAGYEYAFKAFDPTHIPQEKPEGGYDDMELTAFRSRLERYHCTATEFLEFAHELHELKKSQREYEGMLKLLKDARTGFLGMKALEGYQTAPHELPPAYESPKPPVTTVTLRPAPYVAMRTAPAVYHRALTWIAREISARGRRVQGAPFFAPLAAAAATLPTEGPALSRQHVIDTLAPALEHALEESRVVLTDFSRMQADLRLLQRNQKELAARKVAELEAHRDAGNLEAGHALAEIDTLETELHDLNLQLRTAQHLHDSLTVMREQARERRDMLQRLAEFLHHVDPLAADVLRPEALRPVIAEINRLSTPPGASPTE